MLSTDHRAASALMSRRYPPARDYELATAVKEAHRANLVENTEFPPVRAVTAQPSMSRVRALLNRLGIAGT